MKLVKLEAVFCLCFLSLLLFSVPARAFVPSQAVFTDARFIQAVQNQDIQFMNKIMSGKSNERDWNVTWEHWYSPTTPTEWDYNQRYHHTYISGTYPSVILAEMKVNEVWTNLSRNTYTYDNDYNISTYLMENWENDAWVNYMRITYTYAQGHYTQIIGEWYSEGAWTNLYKSIYSYTTNGNVDTIISQGWYGGNWGNSSKSVYSYNNDSQISELLNYVYGGGWLLNSHTLYTYTAFHKMETSLYQSWSITNSVYTDVSRTTYTYNGLQQNTNILNETYQNNAWGNQNQDNMTCDANGNLSEKINQLWNGTSWDNNRKITYEYAQDNANEDNTSPIITLSLTARPNPFSQNTTINIKSEVAGKAALNIYNLKGQLVKSTGLNLTKDKAIEWQWNEKASAGIYFVKVRQNNQALKSLKLVRY